MHEFLGEYGYILYAAYIAIMQSGAVSYLASKHVIVRKKYIYGVVFCVLTMHDLYWSLFGYGAKNIVVPIIEILILGVIVYFIMKMSAVGKTLTNFTHLFAIEWVFQMFLTIFTFPFFMIMTSFDMDKVAHIMDTPSLKNVLCLSFLYMLTCVIANVAWRFVCRTKNKYFPIVTMVFCVLDIGALILYGWRIIVAVFLACAFIIVTSFRQHNKNEKYLREQFAFYQELAHKQTQREKEISVIRHDIANHMNVMEEMQKNDAGQKLLEKIDKTNRNMTGIPVLDCLLREKTVLCEKQTITFIKSGTVIGETGITEYEFVSLFANLLDNAIEAAQKTEKKYVELKIEKQQGVLMITVSNSKQEKQRPLENEFGTTKKDKRKHGIGNRIIRDIVEAHGGRVTYHDQGDVMKVVALMQM